VDLSFEMLNIEPSPSLAPYVYGLALGIAAVAAWTDWRGGHISNYLTLPPVVLGPIAYGLVHGLSGFFGSVLAIVLCALGPYLMFHMGAMAGGDVKLIAALGAICGTTVALEGEFLGLIVASIYALGRLTWDGKLFKTLGNVAFLGLNPILPKRWRRAMSKELMERIRLGGAIFGGLMLSLAGRYQGYLVGLAS
jgi:prepilin peptidase CpaA